MSSGIQYLDEDWNIVTGCGDERVSPGCVHCYARRMTGRNLWSYDFTPNFHADRLDRPRHWKKPRVVGVTFMGDLYHSGITDEQRWAVYQVIEDCLQHTFVDLTKRTKERHDFLRTNEDTDNGWPLANLWQGSTICNQPEADRDIPILLDTPSAVRFVSVEPMLGPIDFRKVPGFNRSGSAGVELLRNFWVIVGGENGPGARPMHPEWALDLYRQCKAAGVAFWWKGWGSAFFKSPHVLSGEAMQMTQTREMGEEGT